MKIPNDVYDTEDLHSRKSKPRNVYSCTDGYTPCTNSLYDVSHLLIADWLTLNVHLRVDGDDVGIVNRQPRHLM